MAHSSRLNYKAKATRVADTPANASAKKEALLATTFLAQEQAREANNTHREAIELAEITSICTEILDDCTRLGDMELEECRLPLDERLPRMNIHVILKRTGHVMSLLGQRLEIASEQLKAFSDIYDILGQQADATTSIAIGLGKGIAETFKVGQRPTSDEIKALGEADEAGESWSRYGMEYNTDVDSDDELEGDGQAVA